jgi:hypothetical protein
MDRLLNMLIRRVMGRLMNRGIDAGITRFTRGSETETTPEQQARTRQTSQRTKQAMRVVRRFGRF